MPDTQPGSAEYERWKEWREQPGDCPVCDRTYDNHFMNEWRWHSEIVQLRGDNERLRAELDEAQLRSIEARNPGIDMDEVRAVRASHKDGDEGPSH